MVLHKLLPRSQSLRDRSFMIFALLPWIILCDLYPQYAETIYDVEDGLKDNRVTDISSDENGFIWVQTTSGVCRFDGHRFQEYTVNLNGIQKPILFSEDFMNDSRGRLWIDGFLPALLLYNNEFDRIELVHEARYHDYMDLADDGQGQILVTGEAGMDFTPILQLKEGPDYAFTAEEFFIPEEFRRNYYIHRFANGTMICSGTLGLSKLEIAEGAPEFERIQLLSAEDSSVYKVDEAFDFLSEDPFSTYLTAMKYCAPLYQGMVPSRIA